MKRKKRKQMSSKLAEEHIFEVIEKYKTPLKLEDLQKNKSTLHFSLDRGDRLITAKSLITEEDEVVDTFLVNKNHTDGYELHNVTKSGLVIVLNESKYFNEEPCLITILIGRPEQIQRLYRPFGLSASQDILQRCKEHQVEGLKI